MQPAFRLCAPAAGLPFASLAHGHDAQPPLKYRRVAVKALADSGRGCSM